MFFLESELGIVTSHTRNARKKRVPHVNLQRAADRCGTGLAFNTGNYAYWV
jgi:hypothetical protein